MEDLETRCEVERLRWLLSVLRSGDADEFRAGLGASLASLIPGGAWASQLAMLHDAIHPFEVSAVELIGRGARARVIHEGQEWMVRCDPDPADESLISWLVVSPVVPPELTPRLPMDFSHYDSHDEASYPDARLIVFSGLPGVGKSTLAEHVGSSLSIPVYSFDWMLGALTPFRGRILEDPFGVGMELLVTLALRQLRTGQSAIMDAPLESVDDRNRLRSLARRFDARFVPIVCMCPDLGEHQRRLEQRTRGIPGWHEAGNWANVQARQESFPPWDDDALIIDTTDALSNNAATVVGFIETQRA